MRMISAATGTLTEAVSHGGAMFLPRQGLSRAGELCEGRGDAPRAFYLRNDIPGVRAAGPPCGSGDGHRADPSLGHRRPRANFSADGTADIRRGDDGPEARALHDDRGAAEPGATRDWRQRSH